MRIFTLTLFLCTLFCIACSEGDAPLPDPNQSDLPPVPTVIDGPYTVEASNLLKDGQTVHFKGVNCLQTFGLTDAKVLDDWQVEISREFIGNLREQPIDGGPIQASDGVWYHPLQTIVDSNRLHNRITILCPFGWVDANGQQTLLTGLNPSAQPFYTPYKDKMQRIAEHFSGQPDVWIEVWNEPYHWNNENGYNHDLWLNDMQDMVDNLRWVNGFQNIILVPGNEQGQSEAAILTKGNDLKAGRYNLLFDIHAYEKWLVNTTEAEVISRIEAIHQQGFPFLFGEVGVQNAGNIMPVQHFLDAAGATDISTLAWLWNQDSSYNNALLTDDGQPHATEANFQWGDRFKAFLEE